MDKKDKKLSYIEDAIDECSRMVARNTQKDIDRIIKKERHMSMKEEILTKLANQVEEIREKADRVLKFANTHSLYFSDEESFFRIAGSIQFAYRNLRSAENFIFDELVRISRSNLNDSFNELYERMESHDSE